MLSESLLTGFVKLGKSIKSNHEQFLDLMRKALVESGTTEWHKGDLPKLFARLEKDVRLPLCEMEDGAKLDKPTFNRLFSAARKALVLGVPFRLSSYMTLPQLAKIKAIADADPSARSMEDKIAAAIKTVKDERKTTAPPCLGKRSVFIPFPTADADAKWLKECFAAIKTVTATLEAQTIKADYPDLLLLDKLCDRALNRNEPPDLEKMLGVA
jgi:hypothetical protein